MLDNCEAIVPEFLSQKLKTKPHTLVCGKTQRVSDLEVDILIEMAPEGFLTHNLSRNQGL